MVSLIGSDGTVSEKEWAEALSLLSEDVVVAPGALAPSVGAGTREAVVGSGWVYCCACFAKFPAAVSATLAANGGTNARKDYRVAEFNWANTVSTLGTPANSVEIKTVQGGGGGGLPALTQTPGVLWQVPCGLYIVPPTGAITVGDVRPRRRLPRVYKDTPAVITMGSGSTGRRLALREIPDPGWPHRLELVGTQSFALLTGNGRGTVTVRVDGVQVTSAEAGRGNATPAVLRPEWTDVRTGPATVEYFAAPYNITGEPLTTLPEHSGFTAIVHPA